MLIRKERADDICAIRTVVAAAFGQLDEADLLERMRADGDLFVSLVAEDEGRIVGHVALSPMTAPFLALGLAPVSVTPERQARGVGSALIREAIGLARDAGCAAIFVLGDQDYYARFGFDVADAAGFTSRYAGPHFAVLALEAPLDARSGEVRYCAAFGE